MAPLTEHSEGEPEITVILPAHNEAGPLPSLLPRIAEVLADRAHEMVVVEDSLRLYEVNPIERRGLRFLELRPRAVGGSLHELD